MRRCIVLLVLVMLGMFSFAWAQPMSGTYTIPGNYPNFNAAISALVSNGVDGAVVFEVSPGTYVEQMVIPQIPSASAENTITFTGTGTRDEVIIQYAPDQDDPYMVRLDGARHFRFDNFTFNVATGASYGFIFHIQNASEDIEITNNIFNNFEATTAFYTHILVSNNNLAYGAGDSHNILIADNVFNDGFTAVRCNGTATEQLTGIEIRNNVINQTYSHGIWLVQNYAPIIEANVIDIRSEEPAMDINSGINLSQVHGPFLISKNKITNPGRHGINLMSGETSPTNRSRIVNNSVGGGFRDSDIYGGAIRISGTVSNLDIFYNSLNLDYGEGSALNVRIATVSGLDIRNNSFAYTGNENGFAMYISNPNMVDALDHNNYYSTDSNFIYYGSDIDDLTALQAVNIPVGNDANSREGNPFYTSPLDLYPLGTQLWAGATPIPGIDEDIEGNPRDDTAPCIGAYEYDALQNDLAAFDIAGPNVAYMGASATYSVTVINFGINTQDDYTVKLMKEGEVELASAHITTPLEANQSIDVELDWIPSMEETTYVYGKVVLIGDENPDNDETDILPVEVLTESLQGTYSINWDGTGDYDSFNQALDDLMDLGVSEPVTFLVHPGTYNEQLFFDGEIPNASPVNTVTFTGIDNERLDAILQFAPASSEDRYVVRFDGTKHVRLDNLKIEAIDTADWGWTVHIMSGCQDIEITNCEIITNEVSIATDYMGIVISGSETSHTAAASNVSDILIENNSIIGGNRGITCRGDSSFDNIQGLQILNNVIDQSHHHGVWIYHATTPLIQHNIIDVRTTMGTSRGISLSYIYGGFDVSYNYITNAGQYGLHLNMSPATADNPNLIYNNSIGGGFRVTSAAGLYLSSSHTHVIYNSINMDYGTQAALRTMAASSNFVALNNSFAYTGDANGYAVYHSHTANVLHHDYNNYYSGTSTNLIYYGGAFDNLGPLQNDGHDLNSHVGNPLYTSNTNLYPTGSQLYAVGTPIPGIVDDILGTPRDDDNPCIGAYEFELPVQPELEVSPDSAHFATTVGGTSLPTSFTLTNIGGGTLAIYDGDIVFTGDDADEFELGELTYPIELGSGETIDISVAFSPQTDGDKTAILEITHSGVNSPYEVSLTGLAYPDNTYIFGVGTEVNNTTTANPINIYYRSLRGQMIYHASELEAAGFEQGNAIIEFGFYVEQEPLYPLPDFIIRMKHTEEDNVAAHDPGPYETVYTTASYMPTPGDWDMIVLDTPFIWNGTDNILVDTAFDLVPEYNSSGQQRIYDVPNGFRYIRSDTQNTTNMTTNVITSNKPQARMVFTDEVLLPQIAVDPEEFVVDIDYGDIITLPMTITNDGAGDLEYSISVLEGDSRMLGLRPGRQRVITEPQPLSQNRDTSLDDRDPRPAEAVMTSPTDHYFNLILSFVPFNQQGEYQVATDGNYIYTARWNSTEFYRYELDGTYVGEFTVAGAGNLRDMTYDGEYFYGSPNSTVIYEMDLDNEVLVSTINTTVASIRSIAYDPDHDAFWVGSGWSPVALQLVSRAGTVITSLPITTGSISGMGWENVFDGGPYLWVYTQGPYLIQLDMTTGAELYIYDFWHYPGLMGGIPGGLVITDLLEPGLFAFLGMIQNQMIWALELGPADLLWLNTDPVSGIVPAGESVDIDVIFDATDPELEPGLYTADIVITHNAGDPVIIPATMNVGEEELLPPVNFAAEVVNVNNVQLNWEEPGTRAVTGYNVYMNGELIVEIEESHITEYLVEGLDNGTYNFYATAIYDDLYESESSNDVDVTIELLPPVDFNAQSQAVYNVLCSWEAPADAVNITHYRVYRDGEQIAEVTTLFYVDQNVPTGTYSYYATALYNEEFESEPSNEVTLDHVEADNLVPKVTELSGNYPNPFNPDTNISFSLSTPSRVQLEIFNIRGEKVRILLDEELPAAYHNIVWDGRDERYRQVSSGIFFYRMRTDDYSSVKKMMLLK